MFAFLLAVATSKVFIQLNEERSFIHWMRTNNQFYTGDEYHFRLGLYLCRTRWINDFNKGQHTFTVGHNKFSTYTPSEYRSLLGANPPDISKPAFSRPSDKQNKINAPDSFDWREKGVINSIRNQGNCRSCWAFSTISSCESSYAIKSGQLLSFSEQNLVDCCSECYGCNGGWPDKAVDHICFVQGGQLNSQKDYPYTGIEGTCKYDSSKAIGEITGYQGIWPGSEEALQEKLVSLGVVSVCIHSGTSEFMSYSGGIFDLPTCSQTFLDHAVNVVGYGTENSVDYWIVRNTWGVEWGEEGYVRMSRNKDNQCGIASAAIVVYTK
ncbi:Digestive cysteine proteinase 2 [Tritrichomonas foetus]|uniref:Digestive cysteine proteinase 2 n=1 Tax=Tritrichomonas foetus TaxID=1144522 RepID=A0A1J4JXB9_9EUKA|nr:Digestive cysteine proteinase 2 [Tritrichomonas foetus]|eukprot:OHT02180.1 Digestive cysteine proteinase 2 [Tritrichomonas foetus]